MAKRIMQERMPELATYLQKKEERKEIQSTEDLRLIGAKRILISHLEKDIYRSSRYKQILNQTSLMLKSGKINIDKHRVKDVVKSLRNSNRELLKSNNIEEHADDFIYLSLVLKNSILETSETVKAPKPAPVQLRLPFQF